MDAERNRKTGRILAVLSIGELALAVAVMIWGMLKGTLTTRQSNVLISCALAIYWILTDLAEPVLLHRFENLTQERKIAYVKYILFDLLGFIGIACFLFGVGGMGGQNGGLLGGVIYVVAMRPKRENQKIFYGTTETEEVREREP